MVLACPLRCVSLRWAKMKLLLTATPVGMGGSTAFAAVLTAGLRARRSMAWSNASRALRYCCSSSSWRSAQTRTHKLGYRDLDFRTYDGSPE